MTLNNVKVYQPPGKDGQVPSLIEGLEPRLREKVVRQIFSLSQIPPPLLKEPHYKHFTIERYRELYELREKGKALIRVIFTVLPSGEVLLLYAFVKRQRRDTMHALDRSLGILAELREHPEYAVEYKVKEEIQT